MKSRFSHSLGLKFLLYILLFSSLITLSFTALQIFFDLQSGKKQIERYLQHIHDSHIETLVHAVWIDDREAVMSHLKGISYLPDIEYLEISKGDVLLSSLGSPVSEQNIIREYPLLYTYNDQEYSLGILKAVATLENLHQLLLDRVLVILASEAVKTLLVSIFIFFIFYLVVGKHLHTLAEYTRTLNVDQLDIPPPLIRSFSTSKKDELAQLTFSINEMREGFSQSLQELNRYHHHLEELVEERTREIQNAQQALKESETRFRGLSEAAFEGIIVSDKGKIIEVNKSMGEMFGYALPEFTGMPAIELVAPGLRKELEEKILSGYELPYECSCLKKDGTLFPTEVHGKVFLYKGQQVRVTAVRDITARKQAEEEIKKLRGILPICASCKKIRDDKGYWNQIESYIQEHSEAEFSHGICQDCAKKLYPDLVDKDGNVK